MTVSKSANNVRRLDFAVNVTEPRFGARGNGTDNDAPAIQLAIDYVAARSPGGGYIDIPYGRYKLNTALDLTYKNGVVLRGQGAWVSPNVDYRDEGVTNLLANTGNVAVDMTGSPGCGLEDLQIRGLTTYSNPSKVGILCARTAAFPTCQFIHLDRVKVYLQSTPAATIRGTVGLYNVGAEHFTSDQFHSYTDMPALFCTTDILGLNSPFRGALLATTMSFVNMRMPVFISLGGGWACFETSNALQIDLYNPYFSTVQAAPEGAISIGGGSTAYDINIHNAEIEGLNYIGTLNTNVSGLNFDGSIGDFGAMAPEALFQWAANALTVAKSNIRARQWSGAKQVLFANNATEIITDSIINLSSTAGITGPAIKNSILLADDAASATISPAAGSSYILMGPNGPVVKGLFEVQGDGTQMLKFAADATDPTGGGGAAAGRIPINIGGVTKYLPYY